MKTPRRTRNCTLHARSLDSYREGSRFNNEIPGTDDPLRAVPAQRKPPKVKQRIALTKAMSKLNIASMETCAFLVRSGCVRVNGQVVRDEKAKIHRFDDSFTVNETLYGPIGSPETESLTRDSDFADDIDPDILPRSQRDFPQNVDYGSMDNRKTKKKFSRRVDRGYYSSQRFESGK